MARKPNYDTSKLPQWVQARLQGYEQIITDLTDERDSLLEQLNNMEYALEHLSKQQVELEPGTTITTVDL